MQNIGEDFKKLGSDIRDVYTKLGYKIPKNSSRGLDLPKILLIISLVSLVILPVIGVPVALILISIALYILWQKP